MKECLGKWFLLNGDVKHVDEFDNSRVYKGDSVYEVIRLKKGIPYFYKDHMARLENSVKLQGKSMLRSVDEIRDDIVRLAATDKRREVNIKLVFNYGIEGLNSCLIYYIESVYPTEEQYSKGVKGILFFAERKDPESKVINFMLKTSIHQELAETGAHEALLVNDDNEITEGSRSNIFFLKGEKLVTAPDNMVLKGITRKYLLHICSEKGIEVEYKCVDADDIQKYDSVFMTGTSPMVLPFNSVDDLHFSTAHPLLRKLRELYIQKAEESMADFK